MKKYLKISLISILALYGIYFIFPYFVKLELREIPKSQVIYDSNDEEIWEIIIDKKYRHREIDYSLKDYDFLKKIVVSLEDKRFYYHSWIDYISLTRAFFHDLLAWKIIEWASTIDSQVIRNNLWLNESRWYKTKIKEFILALALNKKYSKDEILNIYLNNIYFGYLNYGFESASQYYFAKSVKNLTKAEILALSTIPKNSNNYDPYKKENAFKKRFLLLANTLKERKIISEWEYEDITQEKLIWNTEHNNKLPYVVDFIKSKAHPSPILIGEGTEGNYNIKNNNSYFSPLAYKERGRGWGLTKNREEWKIQTTIDYYQTKAIEKLAYNDILRLFWKNVTDYSVIVLDKKTNDLKVMIGWIDYFWLNGQVNSALALRQAGSSIKPFTYYLAFKNLWLNPDSKILDLPISFQTMQWYEYSPKNYDLKYHWEVSLAEALSQSINIPAVKLAEKVWTENLLEFLKKVWITSLNEKAEHYWLALTLGVWEVSLYELTRAYSIFAHDWDLCDINIKAHPGSLLTGEGINCQKVADKKYTDMVSSILTNRYFKLGWFPINSSLDFADRNVFVKTGTSRNFRDNWAIGYTDNYIIWVWVGNKDASNMKWVSGASWAWEIFRDIVYYLEPNDVEREIPKETWEKIEKYLEITSPLENSVYQIDKNKSLDYQHIKIEFSTNYDYDKVFYIVDDEILKNEFWQIKTGNHKLQIKLMKDWKIINSVNRTIKVE